MSQIPTSLRIGKKLYKVELPDHMPNVLVVGNIAFGSQTIKVAARTGRPLRKRSEKARLTTFWHEVVHGILYDMRSPKNTDEIFVQGIATRLVQVTQSAKFSSRE